MDGWEFTSSVIDSLAWPAAIAVPAVMFRRQIRDAFGTMFAVPPKRVRAGSFEAEWDREASTVHDDVRDAPPESKTDAPGDGGGGTGRDAWFRDFADRLDVDATGAIVGTYRLLVELLERDLRDVDVPTRDPRGRVRPLGFLAGVASNEGILSDSTATGLARLAEMRNLAAHAVEPVDAQRARDFIALAESVYSASKSDIAAYHMARADDG